MTTKLEVVSGVSSVDTESSSATLVVEGGPPRRGSRDSLFAAVGVIFGALLAFGLDVLKDRVTADMVVNEHPPAVAVSRLFISTPEILVPNVAVPTPPNEVRRRVEDLKDNLLLTNEHVTVRAAEAIAVSDLVHKSHALDSVDTPLGHLDVDAWRDDIGKATGTIASSYIRKPFLQKLYEKALASKGLSNDERKASFEATVAEADGVGQAFRDAAIFYGVLVSSDPLKSIDAKIDLMMQRTPPSKYRWPLTFTNDGFAVVFVGGVAVLLTSARNRGYTVKFTGEMRA